MSFYSLLRKKVEENNLDYNTAVKVYNDVFRTIKEQINKNYPKYSSYIYKLTSRIWGLGAFISKKPRFDQRVVCNNHKYNKNKENGPTI